ncbi:glycoside hydrolase family 127 protein, partial [bacterium]|nr:glycoside hydrolase family 127 protein [bacterium]
MRNLPRREAGLAVLLVVLLWSALPAGAPSVVTVKPAVSEALRPPAPGEVSLGGYLGGKIDLCIRNRVLAQDAESLIEPFRRREETRWWQSEFWGKWFTSLALAERYAPGPEVAARMRDAVRGLVATQSADGYIGNYSPSAQLEQWDIWGRKYCLLGLLADYESRGDTLALNAARREADFLLSQVGPGKADIVHTGNYRGMASCSVLEPIVWLYRATGDKRYLDFARYIVERIESPDGPRLIAQALDGVPVARRFPHPEKWWGWENGMKAYEMMSCYEGLVELYKVTGQAEYLRAAEAAWQSIRDTEINVAGGGSSRECWYGGGRHQARTALSSMETCVSVTWLRFSTRLLALTGDPRYAEAVERTLYNALLGAMTPDGADFAKYSPLEGVRNPGENQCGMTLHCCNANGARALLAVPLVAVMASDSGPVLNLYCAGRTVVRLPSGNRVEIVTETAYPFDSTVTVRVNPARAERFSLRLRVPSWSARTSIEPGRA